MTLRSTNLRWEGRIPRSIVPVSTYSTANPFEVTTENVFSSTKSEEHSLSKAVSNATTASRPCTVSQSESDQHAYSTSCVMNSLTATKSCSLNALMSWSTHLSVERDVTAPFWRWAPG